MKKIISCALKAFIATILTLFIFYLLIKVGIWSFSLNPVIGIIILFAIVTFITSFLVFYGTLDYGIMEKYRKYIDGDDDV